MKKYFIDSTKR